MAKAAGKTLVTMDAGLCGYSSSSKQATARIGGSMGSVGGGTHWSLIWLVASTGKLHSSVDPLVPVAGSIGVPGLRWQCQVASPRL